jgi:hypothetical protein
MREESVSPERRKGESQKEITQIQTAYGLLIRTHSTLPQ